MPHAPPLALGASPADSGLRGIQGQLPRDGVTEVTSLEDGSQQRHVVSRQRHQSSPTHARERLTANIRYTRYFKDSHPLLLNFAPVASMVIGFALETRVSDWIPCKTMSSGDKGCPLLAHECCCHEGASGIWGHDACVDAGFLLTSHARTECERTVHPETSSFP